MLQGGVGALIKEPLRFIHLTKQQLLTGEEDLDAGLAAVLEAFVGLEDPFGLALGEARGGQGKAREEVGGGRTAIAPAAEELHLLLSRQELADLLEERLELALGEGQIGVALEATALLHELLQQGDALLAGAAGGEVAADQIEHAIGQQFLEVLLELATLLGLLAHALQQLQALLQGQGGRFIAALVAVIPGGALAGQSGEQGQVGFAAAAQGGGLGRLQSAGGAVEGFLGLAGLH